MTRTQDEQTEKQAGNTPPKRAFWITLLLAVVVYTVPLLAFVAMVSGWIPFLAEIVSPSGWPIPLLYLIPFFWIPVELFNRFGYQFAVLYFVVIFGSLGLSIVWLTILA